MISPAWCSHLCDSLPLRVGWTRRLISSKQSSGKWWMSLLGLVTERLWRPSCGPSSGVDEVSCHVGLPYGEACGEEVRKTFCQQPAGNWGFNPSTACEELSLGNNHVSKLDSRPLPSWALRWGPYDISIGILTEPCEGPWIPWDMQLNHIWLAETTRT